MHRHLRLGTLLALLLSGCDAASGADAGERSDSGDAAVVARLVASDGPAATSSVSATERSANDATAATRGDGAGRGDGIGIGAGVGVGDGAGIGDGTGIELPPEPSFPAPIDTAPAATDDEREPTPPPGFSFVFTHGRTYVVLATRTFDEWGTGPLTLISREGPMLVVRAVDRARLPSETRALLERRFVLLDGAEQRCTAELGEPMLLRRVDPHFSTLMRWNGEDGAPPPSDGVVAQEGWELVPEAQLLVAEARTVTGSCARAHWAHPEDTGPDLGSPARIPASRVVAAFRRLESHRELQSAWREAREYDDDPGFAHWDARPGAFREIVRFRSRDGRRFALVSARAHDGCGDFTGGLYALFEQGPNGALVHVTSGLAYEELPRALVDLDDDGVPEILFRSRLARANGEIVDITTPYLDCPC